MDIVGDSPAIRWGARIFLIIVLGGIIYLFWKNKNAGYDYSGLKSYKLGLPVDGGLLAGVHQGGRQVAEAALSRFFKKAVKTPRVNKTEELCRQIVQKIYNRPFPSVRPDFLKSPMTKKNLELDCYNSDLKIAIEYNGQQHYTYTPHFHKNKKAFFSQVHRDDWKRKKCREMGIRLIEIPYWITEMNLENYIRRELSKKGCL